MTALEIVANALWRNARTAVTADDPNDIAEALDVIEGIAKSGTTHDSLKQCAASTYQHLTLRFIGEG